MSLILSDRARIFLIAWMVYSIHFATNVVREHYPAFSIAQHGTFRVDEYQGFHSDIFVHTDGHAVIGNQVLVSTLAAVPLFVFSPVLDALERYSKAKLSSGAEIVGEYRTDKPMRRQFFQLVRERGLDLRFGAATAITTIFFMAPLTAFFLASFFSLLRERGVDRERAARLALLLGFGTPLFFRATVLGHNMFVMFAMFLAFVHLWVRPGMPLPVTFRHRLAAGFFAGVTLATDYIGVLILPLLWAYLVVVRRSSASWGVSIRESLVMVLGSIPPIAFLLYSQWAMYGNPFWPGQHWMPDQNAYVNTGAGGFTWPDPELFWQNLFHPGFGLFSWSPLLLLALVPVAKYSRASLILPMRERWFVIAASVVLLLFCSSNQYARLQWNSGFRYLLPLVPFLFLALSDHLVRMPSWAVSLLAGVSVLHSWVLTVFREDVFRSWSLFLAEGPQLPWFRVLGMTASSQSPWLASWYVPAILLSVTAAAVVVVWRQGFSPAVAIPAAKLSTGGSR